MLVNSESMLHTHAVLGGQCRILFVHQKWWVLLFYQCSI